MRALPVVLLLGCATASFAQEPAPAGSPAAGSPAAAQAPSGAAPDVEALHQELRRLRDDILGAIDRQDFDAILPYLHPNVVFTPMNGEVCRGPAEIRAYFERMMKGSGAVVKSVRLDLEVDRLADLYGDTGLAFGSSNDHYTLAGGLEFPVRTRWTCSLVRENGRWLITGFHSSANVFDNPILARATQAAKVQWGGAGAGLGVLIGAIAGVAVGRRRQA